MKHYRMRYTGAKWDRSGNMSRTYLDVVIPLLRKHHETVRVLPLFCFSLKDDEDELFLTITLSMPSCIKLVEVDECYT